LVVVGRLVPTVEAFRRRGAGWGVVAFFSNIAGGCVVGVSRRGTAVLISWWARSFSRWVELLLRTR
jgi:hypothetical protein